MPSHFLCWPLLFGVAILFPPFDETHSALRAATFAEYYDTADSASQRLLDARLNEVQRRAYRGEQRAIPNPTFLGSTEELGNDDASLQERTIGVRQEVGFLWTIIAQQSPASDR